MFKVTRVKEEFNREKVLVVGVDACKGSLEVYCEIVAGDERQELRDSVKNQSAAIRQAIANWKHVAVKHGYDTVLVACEPTGGFEKRFLRLARQGGCYTCYVSGEAVSKSKVIESNDASKSDPKDARIIFRLARDRRTLTVSDLSAVYEQLRIVNRLYEKECLRAGDLRNEIHHELKMLFPDLQISNDQLFGPLGKALIALFGLDPRQICALCCSGFADKVREQLGEQRVMKKTLQKIYRQAQEDSLHMEHSGTVLLRVERLRQLYAQLEQHLELKLQYRKKLEGLYRESEEYRKWCELPKTTDFQLARVLAETGPLAQFASYRQVHRFLGMNLRIRQSGTYKGLTTLSKKGRSLGRKTLYQLVCLGMIGKGCLLAQPYQAMKDRGKKPMKAMVAMMRKALRMLWGLARSAQAFDLQRMNSPLKEPAKVA